jgi:YbbR domain-containing protein
VIISSTLASVKVRALGAASNQGVSLDTTSLSVTVTGPQLLVEKLRAADVTAYVDVTGLADGEYVLPLVFRAEDQDVSSLVFESTPATIVATIFEH